MLCETDALTEPSDTCPVGSYCVSGTSTESDGEACTDDTFCPQGSTWPMTCRTGYYQPSNGQGKCIVCPAGYYCYGGDKESCPVGYVCE